MWDILTKDSVIWWVDIISHILKKTRYVLILFISRKEIYWIRRKKRVLKHYCLHYGKKTVKLSAVLNTLRSPMLYSYILRKIFFRASIRSMSFYVTNLLKY